MSQLASIPPRPANAPSGSEFARSIRGLSGRARDEAIVNEIMRGNIPDFMRQLQPVQLGNPERGGPSIIIYVMPDYLSVGSNEDSVRVPLGFHAAAEIAARFGAILPTRRMVDEIAEQAENRLTPSPMPPGGQMTSTDYFVSHDNNIDASFAGRHGRLGGLTAGHKKDIVLTPRLINQPGQVPIYGWHQDNGRPIQPLSLVHGAEYADYSHGVRLVSEWVYVNGQRRSVYDVLADPALSRYLSDEGPFPQAAGLMERYSGIRRGASSAAPTAVDPAGSATPGSTYAAATPPLSTTGGDNGQPTATDRPVVPLADATSRDPVTPVSASVDGIGEALLAILNALFSGNGNFRDIFATGREAGPNGSPNGGPTQVADARPRTRTEPAPTIQA
jgi:hypothetical protein